MKNYFVIVIILIAFTNTSCKKKTANDGYYCQNFDDLKMWTKDCPHITDAYAHSGRYSTFTNYENEYSQTFEMPYEFAKSKGYKKLKVSAWGYIENTTSKASLVASVESSEKSFAREGIMFTEYLRGPNRWGKIVVRLNLPTDASKDSKIKVYCWSPDKQNAFLDDVEIEFN